MKETYSSIKGIYRDILKDRNNTVIFDSGWVSNVIVNGCRILLAAFMKNDQTKQAIGIQHLKVGQGDPAWDTNGVPPPTALLEGLEDPSPVEVANLDLVYLDDQDAAAIVPTPRLQITATLVEGVPPPPESHVSTYPLREFGLFGEYDDGETTHEYMIDCIRHPVIHKDETATLIRTVRLYF